jgi:hypothetical protein
MVSDIGNSGLMVRILAILSAIHLEIVSALGGKIVQICLDAFQFVERILDGRVVLTQQVRDARVLVTQ